MQGTRATIVLVDDESSIRRTIVRTLERNGFAVVEVATAEEGLRIFTEHRLPIDLAIIDLVMPGMSGMDLAAELIREYPKVPILYTSGYAGSVAMETIARSSPDAVLAKPFTQEVLLERVQLLLGRRAGAAPASDV